jgi:flagellar basal-body rod protein FlgB
MDGLGLPGNRRRNVSNWIGDDLALKALSYALDGLSLRQRVTANNVANVDTPGFKAGKVDFETSLQRALRNDDDTCLPMLTTHQDHVSLVSTPAAPAPNVEYKDDQVRNDGNNVDIDVEMTNLAETAIRYQALAQLAGLKLSLLKTIVRDSR